jgi:transcriptional regulator with XRE-family HTH domain
VNEVASLSEEVGKRIRRVREALDISQEELGAKAGVARVTINRLENGHRKQVDPELVRRIARVLGCQETELYPLNFEPAALQSYLTRSNLPTSLQASLAKLLTLPRLEQQRVGSVLEELLLWHESRPSTQ